MSFPSLSLNYLSLELDACDCDRGHYDPDCGTALLNTDTPLRSPGERNARRRGKTRWGIIPWWSLDLPPFPLLERSLDQIRMTGERKAIYSLQAAACRIPLFRSDQDPVGLLPRY
jgi:hypothetical protein